MIAENPTEYWEIKGKDKDGITELELDPELQVIEPEELTLDKVTTLCNLLQVDPDRVLGVSDGPIELPEYPPLNTVQEFFDILVVNSDDYNIGEMPASQVKLIVGALTMYFTKACQQS